MKTALIAFAALGLATTVAYADDSSNAPMNNSKSPGTTGAMSTPTAPAVATDPQQVQAQQGDPAKHSGRNRRSGSWRRDQLADADRQGRQRQVASILVSRQSPHLRYGLFCCRCARLDPASLVTGRCHLPDVVGLLR